MIIVEELAASFGLAIDQAAFTKAEQLLAGLRTGLMGVVGVVATAVAGIGAAVAITAHAGDEAHKVAQQLGMSTDALQGLQYAMIATGGTAEAMTVGIKHLALQVTSAAEGSQEARLNFSRLGISLRDETGKLKTPDALIGSLADKFAAMPPGLLRTGQAVKLFGRSGQEMIPLLLKGSKGIEELKQRAAELGYILDEKTIEASHQFEISSRELGATLRGLAYTIGGPLISEFSDLMKQIAHFISTNRQLISMPIVAFFRGLSTVVRFLASDTAAAKMVWLGLKILLATKVLVAVKALEFGFDALKWSSVKAAWASARAWLAATLPLLAIGAILYYLTDDLYGFTQGIDSVTGRIVKWADTLNPEDGPGVAFFKRLVSLVEDVTDPKKWQRLGLAWDDLIKNTTLGRILETFFGPAIAIPGKLIKAIGDKPGQDDTSEGEKNAKDIWAMRQDALRRAKNPGQLTNNGGYGRVGAATMSPEEAAVMETMRYRIHPEQDPKNKARDQMALSAAQIAIAINVKTNATPEEIAHHTKKAVKKAIQEHEDEQNRAAYASASGAN